MKDIKYKITGFNHCEFYVSNAKQAAYFFNHAMGFNTIAYKGLETGSRDHTSYVVNQGKINFILTSPLTSKGEIVNHLVKHSDGIKDVAFTVDNAELAWQNSIELGAENVSKPVKINDEHGEAIISSIKTFGDTIHTFVEKQNYNGPFLPGFISNFSNKKNTDAGLIHIDHVVGNQPENKMLEVCEFYETIFGWHRFWTVDDKDISTDFTSLRSIVMANDNEIIKIPINEPAPGLKKSQIQEFIDYYQDSGIQHMALSTKDIITTVKTLRKNGVEFLKTPKSYYDNLSDRVGDIDENIETLSELGILVDRDENGYMLQIFTSPIQDRPTLFLEIIQRKGSNSFGKGNFKALFESIEKEQEKRGNL